MTNEGGTATATMGLSTIDTGFEVTSLEDNLVADGELTLREAVRNANAEPDANIITFADDIAGGTIDLTEGQLEITSSLTIEGQSVTIDQKTDHSRVLEINGSEANSAIVVHLDELTITGGDSSYGGFESGGGIKLHDAALNLTDSRVSENKSIYGAGLSISVGSSAIVSNSEIANNSTKYFCIYGYDVDDGFGYIIYSRCLEYQYGYGGGIFNSGELLVNSSRIADNHSFSGGGIWSEGQAIFVDSEINGNRIGALVGDGTDDDYWWADGGGSAIINLGYAGISNSNIVDNHGFDDGEIIANNGQMKLNNSTVIQNYFDGDLANIGSIHIEQSTIGNVEISNMGEISLINSIVRGIRGAGEINVMGANLVEDGSVTGANVINTDPLLGPLEDNGGVTPTLALLPGSPAIDAGDPAFGTTTDQRGFARDVAPDIGAFEVQTANPDDDLSYIPVTAIPDAAVLGNDDDNRLDGTRSAEYFNARAGSDDQIGDGGNDVFLMGPGRDFIGGGGGSDTALFDGLVDDYDGLIFDGDLTYFVTDTNPADGDSGRDRLGGVEIFEFKDAVFDATNGDITPKTDGSLSYVPVVDIPSREGFGTDDDNRLVGSKAAEYFDAGGGSDTDIGEGGDDVFLMGPGRDFIGGGGGNDTAIFDGLIEDFAGLIFDGDLTYFITDTNPADSDSGRDRLGGVETFEFKDAVFDATNGDITFKSDGAAALDLTSLVIELDLPVS